MSDIEKISKALKCRAEAGNRCSNPCERFGMCEYAKLIVGNDGEPYYPYVCDKKRICEDALELLKEQRKTGHWIVLTMCANEGIYCSECGIKVFDFVTKPKQKLSQYCPHCGSKNEQFFKDGEIVFR